MVDTQSLPFAAAQFRTILWLKYKIKDQDVFDKAYSYIEMYYLKR